MVANSLRGRERLARLVEADGHLSKVRIYLRLAYDWRWLNPGQYEHAAHMVAEIGSLLGGWRSISIVNFQAGTVVFGDQTVDQRGSQITVGGSGGQGDTPAGSGGVDVKASLQRQIAEMEENWLLIAERKSTYVLETDMPLSLIKEERRLMAKLEELRQQSDESGDCSENNPQTTVRGSSLAV